MSPDTKKFTPDEKLLAEIMDYLGNLDDPCGCDGEIDAAGRAHGTTCPSCLAAELFKRVASRLGYTWVNSGSTPSPGVREAGAPPRVVR